MMPLLNTLLAATIGCGFWGIPCPAPSMPPTPQVSIETQATSSSPVVTVTTDVNGKSTTRTLEAPYGVQTNVSLRSVNGSTTEEATTTPITAADIKTQEKQFAAMQQQMDQVFADQQWLFDDMMKF